MAKIEVARPCEIEFDAIRLVAEMRYPDEDCAEWPGGFEKFPFLKGETWDVVIDLEPVAKIRNWPGGAFNLYTKVCDCCSVYLLDGGATVLDRENEYVPGFFPGNHYGDYVIFEIADDGTITNWKKNPNYEEAFP